MYETLRIGMRKGWKEFCAYNSRTSPVYRNGEADDPSGWIWTAPISASFSSNRSSLPHHVPLDSIAVSLFTDSETAASTPLRVMRNFQQTLNQWRHNLTNCFLIDGPSHICLLTSEYIFVEFCSISRSWGGHFLNLFLNFAFLRIILDIDTNRWR